MSPTFRRFVSDRDGRIVIAQRPNLPITAWVVLRVAEWLLPTGHARDVVGFFASAFLFTWAWLELTDGDSPFRRVLGGAVLAAMVLSRVLSS